MAWDTGCRKHKSTQCNTLVVAFTTDDGRETQIGRMDDITEREPTRRYEVDPNTTEHVPQRHTSRLTPQVWPLVAFSHLHYPADQLTVFYFESKAHLHHYTDVDGFDLSLFKTSQRALEDLHADYEALENQTESGEVPNLPRLEISD
ncbi:unnamed protein product [Echinostoma caproni]|uniref:DUF5753 domain-containing protein n=1 Tax=Echinostoma caproni TaxID=27848 RepID=A0A183BA25_9TREM|nr:unnamed protein product [Echinostoma caproni]